MKSLLIIFISLLVACVHSKTNTASIPCSGIKIKNPTKNLHYDWTYPINKNMLKKSTDCGTDIKSRLSVGNDGTLFIRKFTYNDWGKYVCRLKDGHTVLDEIVVDVTDKYIIVSDAERPIEECPSWACIAREKCSNPDTRVCPDGTDACCPRMREEDKHRCRHFLGECMETCHENLRATRADDCPQGSMCCVLV
ncbi:PREDICTED: uncharacterized protein LOC105360760 [Ceratosolen solmsi marchali]|uniref:Uncharacterized protein LOC105360760 n=1 Tax=Ceratosolen solmsi marchali TaxID=326594 RepID=A0AAJ6YDH5_9HYME|nr:PREDICTED: uncharacterized protein LOC105360760 [Ceratosolen solmsi marchali]